jgi:hypothetical protein
VKDSQAAGGDRWRCVASANSVERGIVPIGHDVAIGWDANTRHNIYSADADNEYQTSKRIFHWVLSF